MKQTAKEARTNAFQTERYWEFFFLLGYTVWYFSPHFLLRLKTLSSSVMSVVRGPVQKHAHKWRLKLHLCSVVLAIYHQSCLCITQTEGQERMHLLSNSGHMFPMFKLKERQRGEKDPQNRRQIEFQSKFWAINTLIKLQLHCRVFCHYVTVAKAT